VSLIRGALAGDGTLRLLRGKRDRVGPSDGRGAGVPGVQGGRLEVAREAGAGGSSSTAEAAST